MTPLKLFILIVLAGAIITVTVPLAHADAMTLGIQDQGADTQTLITNAHLIGATTIRIIAKPGQPHLEQVQAYRQAGFQVQAAIVVKRQTTSQDILSLVRSWRGMVRTVSVGNEPELNGVSACAYARMFARVQPRLKRMGLTVGFGEFSPATPFEYVQQIARCHVSKPGIRADFTAVHPYQFFSDPLGRPSERSGVGTWLGLGNLGSYRALLRRLLLPRRLRATEFSYLTTGPYRISPTRAASYWPRAIKQAQRWVDQLVIYGLGEVHDSSTWGSASLLDRFGRITPAYRALAQALGRLLPPDQEPPPAPRGDLVVPSPNLEPAHPALIPAAPPETATGASSDHSVPVVITDPPMDNGTPQPQETPPAADEPAEAPDPLTDPTPTPEEPTP